jgi:hypothetical protein
MAEKADADEKDQTQPTVQRRVVERTLIHEVEEQPPGPNATTEPPEGHYFTMPDGTEVNAFGEPKGSKEDKARRAAGTIA